MGSTGKVKTPALPTPAPTPAGLPDNTDIATATKYYKDNYGIDVGGSYARDKCDPKVLARTSQVLDKLAAELGKDTLEAMGIRIVSHKGKGYAQTNIKDRQIVVNSSKFQSYDQLKADMHHDVSVGFHPKGMQAGDVIIHEFGHNLEFLINERQNPHNRMNMMLADADQTYARAIVKAAYKELKQEQPTLYRTEKQARAAISRYADSMWHGSVAYTECMAEAVADYGRNGMNAKPLSIKIWQGIKEMLK